MNSALLYFLKLHVDTKVLSYSQIRKLQELGEVNKGQELEPL